MSSITSRTWRSPNTFETTCTATKAFAKHSFQRFMHHLNTRSTPTSIHQAIHASKSGSTCRSRYRVHPPYIRARTRQRHLSRSRSTSGGRRHPVRRSPMARGSRNIRTAISFPPARFARHTTRPAHHGSRTGMQEWKQTSGRCSRGQHYEGRSGSFQDPLRMRLPERRRRTRER